MSRARCAVAVTLVAAALGGCTVVDPAPPDPTDNPPQRTSWVLRHGVVESAGLQITGNTLSSYDESTRVSLDGADESCYVSLTAPGQGGPDRMVGEKIPTEVSGRPGFRSGAGAEGDYLMWQLADTSWVEVDCGGDQPRRSIDRVVAALRLERTSVRLPFDVAALPEGFDVAIIMQDRQRGSTDVYLGRTQPQFGGLANSDLQISYEARDPLRLPSGRPITIRGRPAMLEENEQSPEVCLLVQRRHVCVGITASDTGPYPDRSADVPTLVALAEALTVAEDLDDRSTWFAADRVFG